MKTFTVFIFSILTLSFSVCYSQGNHIKESTMTKEVEAIIQLGKDAIIQLALKTINEKVSIDNFTKTRIATNGSEVFVSFRNPIKYLPIDSIFYFDISVNLSSGTVYKNAVANPESYSEEKNIPFYKQSKDIKRHIHFVIEAISNMELLDIDGFEDDMIIREHENFYAIAIISSSQESSYKIKKGSGEIYDTAHAHLEPTPFEIDNNETYKVIDFSKLKN